MAWATIPQARAHWPDSASLDDATLSTLLDVASIQCEIYAPRELLSATTTADTVTASSTVTASGEGFFHPIDVGALVTGAGIPAGPPGPKTTITAVAPDGATATLSQAATATGTAITLTLARVLPQPWMLATVYQAREVYAAGQRDGDIIGLGDYAIRARPLTGTVKSLLRPQPGRPKVG